MNQQNHGSSSPPMKRKRGRPRKEGSADLRQKIFLPSSFGDMMNSGQAAVKTEDRNHATVGTMINGVITGTFDSGYLVKVQIPGTDTPLSGCVFIPGQFEPITAENDVAPDVSMIQQKDIPIPSFDQRALMDDFVPRKPTKHLAKSEAFSFKDRPVLPTEFHSGISASLGNQCPSAISMADIPIAKSINLVSVIKNNGKEATARKQAITPVNTLRELLHGQAKNPNIVLSQTLLSAEPKSMPSELISKAVDNSVEKQDFPEILHKTKTKLGAETPREAANSNSNGGSRADIFEGESVTSEFRVASRGSDFLEKNGCSFGGVDDVNANQSNESVKSENLVGTQTPLGN